MKPVSTLEPSCPSVAKYSLTFVLCECLVCVETESVLWLSGCQAAVQTPAYCEQAVAVNHGLFHRDYQIFK